MSDPQLQITADGSHTLYIPALDEHYHSIHGAIRESEHVFIREGLKQCTKKEIHVLELGFGTGLNGLLTCLEAMKDGRTIHYTALEKYPLSEELINRLNYGEMLGRKDLYQAIHSAAWEIIQWITPEFCLRKVQTDFSQFDYSAHFDVVYYDAFAPEKQPSAWSLALFEKIHHAMNDGGILTTYCAKGSVRRMLQQAGFDVVRIPGPPGKRQMIRAVNSFSTHLPVSISTLTFQKNIK
ncbi:MAG: tRNA (5-methylaminomethyl-2-thiouridine)(34)-methyltransferase MnmD [Dysgonamonadaceae bacterium]|jgi:tRNA U34 5-methylaminomethyl-2-thiouridine-forming methyltransferase MnmC|nr:tRNA (5-methylaminomethyl-2-thiouridine)(34)-methyltransferase MnmD [Dysgonamonadaceae bacterium]